MKYLKQFANEADYQTFKVSEEFVLPNVSYMVAEDKVAFNPILSGTMQKAGDIVYYSNGELKTSSLDTWSSDLGTAVGVIAIPKDFLPDGKARYISLTNIENVVWDSDFYWDSEDFPQAVDTPLTNYRTAYTIDDNPVISYVYLPSDNFDLPSGSENGDIQPLSELGGTLEDLGGELGGELVGNNSEKYKSSDPLANYKQTSGQCPAPYLEDGSLNSEYIKTISGNNALSDLNGKENTNVLSSLGTSYQIANSIKSHVGSVSNIEWYVPSAGELGILLSRLKAINTSLTALNNSIIPNVKFWTSTECKNYAAFLINFADGQVVSDYKEDTNNVIPFAILN